MSDNLELTSPQTVAVEKQLDAHKKNIRLYSDGVRRSGAQLFGYAYLAGREMEMVAETLDHGQTMKWLASNFPDLSRQTRDNWRDLARNLTPLLPQSMQAIKLKKAFNKKEQAALLDTIPKIMDGAGMIEFNQACKFLKEPEPAGGFQANPRQFQTFLKDTDPPKYHKYLGKTYEQCPPVVRAAFRQSVAAPTTPSAGDQAAAADAGADDQIRYLTAWADKSALHNYDEMSRAKLKELEDARLTFGRILAAALEKRK